MYNQCIYFTPKKHQTNIYYMKHTKIYQARIQRTFITTTFHVFLGLSEHGKFQGLHKYATNDHTSTKNYKKSGCFN